MRTNAGVPAELLALSRWVRHDEQKRPLRADGHGRASSTNPRSWTTHAAAAASTAGVGLGFVLSGDGIVCIDLDDVVDDVVQVPAAREFLERLPAGVWVETSRSGRGLHVWGRAHLPGRGRRFTTTAGLHAEVYATGRFIALGSTRGPRDDVLVDVQDVVDELLAAAQLGAGSRR